LDLVEVKVELHLSIRSAFGTSIGFSVTNDPRGCAW